jgi:hypothetical protein
MCVFGVALTACLSVFAVPEMLLLHVRNVHPLLSITSGCSQLGTTQSAVTNTSGCDWLHLLAPWAYDKQHTCGCIRVIRQPSARFSEPANVYGQPIDSGPLLANKKTCEWMSYAAYTQPETPVARHVNGNAGNVASDFFHHHHVTH